MNHESYTADRLPPQSKEAEMGVIGSVLRDNFVLSDILQIIRQDNFYFDAHQQIFSTIVEIYNDGKPIDLTLLYEALKQKETPRRCRRCRLSCRALGCCTDGGQRSVLCSHRSGKIDGS